MSQQKTKHNVLTVAPMSVFLVIPDGDVLAGAVVVDGGTTLRTASLRNASAGGPVGVGVSSLAKTRRVEG